MRGIVLKKHSLDSAPKRLFEEYTNLINLDSIKIYDKVPICRHFIQYTPNDDDLHKSSKNGFDTLNREQHFIGKTFLLLIDWHLKK